MTKLGKKIVSLVVLVIIGLGITSLFINTQFVERYYLKTKKSELNSVAERVRQTDTIDLQVLINEINKEEGFITIVMPWQDNSEKLNDTLRVSLNDKGINIKKLWVWEEDFKKLTEGNEVNQIYNQGKLNYSVLVKLIRREQEVFFMASLIPHATEILHIVNVFTVSIWMSSLFLMSIVIILFIRQLMKPLTKIKNQAEDIAHLRFKKIEVHTGDELEELAVSINEMSDKLKLSHEELKNKNAFMKQLLSDVSHELKTPIALIKAYSLGIQDGIDDGSFLETIIQQNEEMSNRVEKLLDLSKWEKKDISLKNLDLSQLLKEIIESQSIYNLKQDILLKTEIEEGIIIKSDEAVMNCILTNFITNAIKYTENKKVTIILKRTPKGTCFRITNGVSSQMKEHLPYIWNAFYVGEVSRNKELSGTGLGLYMVKSLFEKYNIRYDVEIENKEISFWMYL